jgi:hypothetical protein
LRRLTSASGSPMSAKMLPLLLVLTGFFIFALHGDFVSNVLPAK